MKQIIEIEVPEGKKAIWKDGRIVYEDILKLPETWEEFCKLYPIKRGEYYISSDSIIMLSDNGNRLYETDRNILPSWEAAQAHLAYMQLHQLRDCYRQGWTPDWKDAESDKYCITYWGNPGEYEVYRYVVNNHFLSFQSKKIAEKFLNNFKDLIEKAGDLI